MSPLTSVTVDLGGTSIPTTRDWRGGLSIYVTEIVGWWGSPNIKGAPPDRPGAHGLFSTPGHLDGRLVSISGVIKADSPELVRDALRSLSALPGIGGPVELTVTEPGGYSTSATVRRAGPVRETWKVPANHVSWQIDVLASSPFRYGPWETRTTRIAPAPQAASGGLAYPLYADAHGDPAGGLDYRPAIPDDSTPLGLLVLTNRGTAEAQIIFTVTTNVQPAGAFVLVDAAASRMLGYTGPIPADGSLVLDCGRHRALLNGASQRTTLVNPLDWLSIPPESSISVIALGSYDVPITAAWRDTWI